MIPAYLSDLRLPKHQNHWSPQKRLRAGLSSNNQLHWPLALRPRLGLPYHDHSGWSCEPQRFRIPISLSLYSTLRAFLKECASLTSMIGLKTISPTVA